MCYIFTDYVMEYIKMFQNKYVMILSKIYILLQHPVLPDNTIFL
jgi:hypothetical protein